MLAYPKYEACQDTGEDWLGEIPRHWQLLRTKNIFRLVCKPAPVNNSEELLSVYSDIGVKPRRELEERGNKASTTDGYWFVKKGDVVVNKLLAWMGAIGVSDYDGVTSPAYDILRAYKPIDSKFYHYLFRNSICISKLKQHSKGIMEMRLRLYFDEFGNIKIPYPPLEDQKRIVEFLDRTTADIDRAISQKQRLIKLLQEQKAILINRAVTKGLNPNVLIRDSGIDVIGAIPKHWTIKKLKHLAGQFMYGTSVDCNTEDSGTPVLRIPNIETGKISLENLKYAKLSKQEEARYLVRIGDILIVRTNGNPQMVGRSALVLEEGHFLFASYLIKVTPKQNISPEFLGLVLNSPSSREALTLSARTSAGNYNLNSQALGDISIPYPPEEEQTKLIDFIQSVTTETDLVISKTLTTIEQLEEFRSVVIANAVTGKIKI